MLGQSDFETLGAVEKVDLPQTGSWPAAVHVFDDDSKWAIKSAIAAQRPLLVRGEPGTGKSQLARAVAAVLGRAFISEVVHSKSECSDLQWYFDTVARLGEAQLLGARKDCTDASKILDNAKFLCPGVLWWAFDWNSAEKQYKISNKSLCRPEKPTNWKPIKGSVLLIDEIDKADADLPNGLLETLGNGAFSVPLFKEEIVGLKKNTTPPFVVITTNEERELPRAFLRRCMVLHMKLPDEKKELIEHLVKRGKAHFKDECDNSVMKAAAEQLVIDREMTSGSRHLRPGQAEYLDVLRALTALAPNDKDRQIDALKKISKFALIKHSSDN